MANADDAVLCDIDLNEAISMYTAVPWHSSYPWATTQSTQRFGGSIVVIYDGDGHSFLGLLKAAVDIARKWGVGQRYIGVIHRLEHEMNRPEDYDHLLALCRSETQGLRRARVISWYSEVDRPVENVGHFTARMLAVCTQTKQDFY